MINEMVGSLNKEGCATKYIRAKHTGLTLISNRAQDQPEAPPRLRFKYHSCPFVSKVAQSLDAEGVLFILFKGLAASRMS